MFFSPQNEDIHPEKEQKIGFMDPQDVRSSTFSPHPPSTGQVPNRMATFRLPTIGKQLWGNLSIVDFAKMMGTRGPIKMPLFS
jgi:hypothetical protein